MPKRYTPVTVAADVEKALRLLEGRWKLVILFHLFGGRVMRFSDLERAIPAITQKMLGQQLKAMGPMALFCERRIRKCRPR
jgi:DNA-binding HxlR family transcriptional regulator